MRTDLPFPFFVTLSRRELLLASLFSLVCLIIGICSAALPEIGGSSEAREAHVIKLMVQQADYVLPSRNGIIPSKPPLFHWIGVIFSELSGRFSPFTARLPSLFAGAAILWVVMALAAGLGGNDTSRRQRLMIWSGIILSTSYEFEKMRTVSMVDMVFSACITLALAPTIQTRLRGWGSSSMLSSIRPVDYLAFFFFSGLAVLAKGPIGIVLPVLMLLPILAIDGGVGAALRQLIRPRAGWILFTLLVIPWYLLAAFRHSDAFLGKQLIFENLKRLTGGEHVNNQPWWFYIPAFLRASIPWSLVFLAGIKVWFFQRPSERGGLRYFPEKLIQALYGSIGLAVLLFSIASGKRDSYLLPMIPWLALVSAPLVMQVIDSLSPMRRAQLQRIVSGVVLLLPFILVGFLALVELSWKTDLMPASPLLALLQGWVASDAAVASLAAGLALFLVPLARRFDPSGEFEIPARALTLLSIVSISLAIGVSIRSQLKNFKPVALQINQQVGDRPLQVVRILRDEFFDGIMYYLDRSVQLVDPSHIADQCQGFALMRYDQWESLRYNSRLATARTVAVYTEIDDQLKGGESNQKILLECAPALPG